MLLPQAIVPGPTLGTTRPSPEIELAHMRDGAGVSLLRATGTIRTIWQADLVHRFTSSQLVRRGGLRSLVQVEVSRFASAAGGV